MKMPQRMTTTISNQMVALIQICRCLYVSISIIIGFSSAAAREKMGWGAYFFRKRDYGAVRGQNRPLLSCLLIFFFEVLCEWYEGGR